MSAIEIILPGESLTLDPQSSGFAHGFGLFETMRLRAGRLELWAAHWRRLTESAADLGIDCSFDPKEVLKSVLNLGKKLPTDGVIKLSLLKEVNSSRLLVYSRPLTSMPESIGLLLESPARINENSPLAGHKTHNYLENLLVFEAAHKAGCYDGLRLNLKGHVAEGGGSNIFFFRGGCMRTPKLESGLLPGVTREVLLEELPVEQGNCRLADILSADAVFLTNSSIGLLPVDWLLSEGRKIPVSSRQHPCFEPARSLLVNRIEASAIEL